MSGPDVEPGGWATAGSSLRRRRSPFLGLLAAALIGGGVAAAAVGLARAVAEVAPSDAEIVARGTVAGLGGPAGRPAWLTAPDDGPLTVWLRLDGVSDSARDQVVGATACAATGADGRREIFRGSRQGTAIDVDRFATIGVFHAPRGAVGVTCRQVPFGRRRLARRLRSEKAFVVVPGRPSERVGSLLWVVGGVAAALLGVPVGLRWRAGRLTRRDLPPA